MNQRMSVDIYKKAYAEYWDISLQGGYESCPLISNDYKLGKSMGHIYRDMESEFTMQIINSLNAFSTHIGTISIWDMVLDKYNEEEQFDLRLEFLKLPMYFCLNQPRSIKDSIQFCSTHLCHQANLMTDVSYKDDLPDDHNIKFRHFLRVSSKWPVAVKLRNTLAQIASDNFVQTTSNYRNRAHHGISPGIEYGLTNLVRRRKTPLGMTYSFGGIEPLTAKQILPALVSEWTYGRESFLCYWEMIQEHLNETGIRAEPEKSL